MCCSVLLKFILRKSERYRGTSCEEFIFLKLTHLLHKLKKRKSCKGRVSSLLETQKSLYRLRKKAFYSNYEKGININCNMSACMNSALLTIYLIPGMLLKPFLKCKLPGTTYALLIWTRSFTFQWIKSVNLCLVFLNCKCRMKIICKETYYTKGNPLISTEITINKYNNKINMLQESLHWSFLGIVYRSALKAAWKAR